MQPIQRRTSKLFLPMKPYVQYVDQMNYKQGIGSWQWQIHQNSQSCKSSWLKIPSLLTIKLILINFIIHGIIVSEHVHETWHIHSQVQMRLKWMFPVWTNSNQFQLLYTMRIHLPDYVYFLLQIAFKLYIICYIYILKAQKSTVCLVLCCPWYTTVLVHTGGYLIACQRGGRCCVGWLIG